MSSNDLATKAFELAEFLFKNEQVTRKQINEFIDNSLGEDERRIIDSAIMATGKFDKISSNPGGFAFRKGKNLTKKLTQADKKNIHNNLLIFLLSNYINFNIFNAVEAKIKEENTICCT